jgi:hypothetical protein
MTADTMEALADVAVVTGANRGIRLEVVRKRSCSTPGSAPSTPNSRSSTRPWR